MTWEGALAAAALLVVGWLAGVLTTAWRWSEGAWSREWTEAARNLTTRVEQSRAETLTAVATLHQALAKSVETFDRLDVSVGNLYDAFVRRGIIKEHRPPMTGEEPSPSIAPRREPPKAT